MISLPPAATQVSRDTASRADGRPPSPNAAALGRQPGPATKPLACKGAPGCLLTKSGAFSQTGERRPAMARDSTGSWAALTTPRGELCRGDACSAARNTHTAFTIEEAMTLITTNPPRGFLVPCQVSLNRL